MLKKVILILLVISIFPILLHAQYRYDGRRVWPTTIGPTQLTTESAVKTASVTIAATKNDTVHFGVFIAQRPVTINKISVAFYAKPSSASGTVLLKVQNYDLSATTDDNLLSTATFDLETLTSRQSKALTLTSTSADLILGSGDFIWIEIASNNTDMIGGTGGVITVEYTVNNP